MRIIFNNPDLQRDFERDGYVKVPFLSEQEIVQCREIHDSLPKPGLEESFYTSHWSRDEGYRRMVHERLNPLIEQKAQAFFKDYMSAYSYFMVKYPGDKGEVTLHQDWSQIDEDQHTGVTIWCPLIDTNLETGSFHIVKNSHRFPTVLRGTGIETRYQGIAKFIEKNYLTEVQAKAGEALMFDQRMLHYSPPNRSNQVRPVVGHVVIPREAKFTHYYLNPKLDNKVVEVYEGDDEFLLKFAFGDDPEKMLTKVGERKPDPIKLSEADFDALYKQFASESNGIFSRLGRSIDNLFSKK